MTLKDIPHEHVEEAEQLLAESAKQMDPQLLRRIGFEILRRVDSDAAEERAVRRLERRGITCAETYDGMVNISGLLDPISGSLVMTALNAGRNPRPRHPSPQEMRHILNYLSTPVTGHSVEPMRWLTSVGNGWSWEPLQRPAPAGPTFWSWWTRTDSGRAKLAASGQQDSTVWDRSPTTELALIGCDSQVSRIVMAGESQVLDVGRSTRTIPPAIRRAVIARDRSCVGYGCHRPPEHCDVHHIVFWSAGGTTSLDNLALVCRHHHQSIHLQGWQIDTDRQTGRKRVTPPIGRYPPRERSP